jgi:predicted ribosomally synthesized peptide with SipW-like signal peptide
LEKGECKRGERESDAKMAISKKLLASMMVIGLLALALGWGTYSWFTSSKTVPGNVFTTGTLDISTSPTSGFITASNLAPGGSVSADLRVDNTGTLDLKYRMVVGYQAGSGALYNALTAEVKRTTTMRYWASWSSDIPNFRVDISVTADGSYVTVRVRAVDPLPPIIPTLSLDQSLNIYIDENHNGIIDASDIMVSVINDYYLRPSPTPSGWQLEPQPSQTLSSIGILVTKASGDVTVKIPYTDISVADMAIIGMRFQAFGYKVLPLPAWVAWLDVTLFHYSGLLNAIPTTRVGEIMTTAEYDQWDTLAFTIGLPTTAGNALQGLSTTVQFTFDATQLANPSWVP